MNVGTNTTPPVSATLSASGPASAASVTMPSPSRSHWIAAPVTKIEPSSAYVAVESSVQATVVSRPSTGGGCDPPRFTSTNEPVPYVFLLIPGVKQAWPKSAACWSPAMPLTGTRRPAAQSGAVTPKRPLVARTLGRHEAGTSNSASSSSDHARESMSNNRVRLAFDASVVCTPPTAAPVRFQRIHESTVPNASVGVRSTPPSVSSHASFVAEK